MGQLKPRLKVLVRYLISTQGAFQLAVPKIVFPVVLRGLPHTQVPWCPGWHRFVQIDPLHLFRWHITFYKSKCYHAAQQKHILNQLFPKLFWRLNAINYSHLTMCFRISNVGNQGIISVLKDYSLNRKWNSNRWLQYNMAKVKAEMCVSDQGCTELKNMISWRWNEVQP